MEFTLPCQLGFSSNYHYFYVIVYRLLLPFLFINKCFPVKKLAQITPKTHTSIAPQLSVYFVMAF